MLHMEMIQSGSLESINMKKRLLDKLSFELTSKTEDASGMSGKKISQVVQSIRQIIQAISTIFQQLGSYLSEVRQPQVSQLLFGSFNLTNQCFKSLSFLFLGFIRNNSNKEPHVKASAQKYIHEREKRKVRRELQEFDCLIRTLQQDEQRLQRQKQEAEQMLFEPNYLNSINPSQAIQELQKLYKQVKKTIQNSDRHESQNFLFRHQELSKVILAFKRPEELVKDLQNQLNQIFSEKVELTKQKLVSIFQKYLNSQIQNKEDKKRIAAIKSIKKNQKQCQTEDIVTKFIMGKKRTKLNQNQTQNSDLNIFQLTRQIQLLKTSNSELSLKSEAFQQRLRVKLSQLQQLQAQNQYQISKKDEQIEYLKSDTKRSLEELRASSEFRHPSDGGQFTKRVGRQQKKYLIAKKCLKQLIIGVQTRFNMQLSTDIELENDISSAKIDKKVKQITEKFVKQKRQQEQQKKRHNFDISTGTQTQFQRLPAKILTENIAGKRQSADRSKQNIYTPRQNISGLNSSDSTFRKKSNFKKEAENRVSLRIRQKMKKQNSMEPAADSGRLQNLKKQLIDRAKERAMKKGSEQILEQIQFDKSDLSKIQTQRNKEKSGFSLSKKNIAFQDLNMAQIMVGIATGKKENIFKRGSRTVVTEPNSKDERLCSLEKNDLMEEVRRVMCFIDAKNDEKDAFVGLFLQQILGQINLKKGWKVIKNVVRGLETSNYANQKSQIFPNPTS